jgi:hypothetical protein
MNATGRKNELKKMAGLDAVDDGLPPFGSGEVSCFLIIVVQKVILC